MVERLRAAEEAATRGADLPETWPQLAKLGVFLVVMLGIAVARFKKRLD